MKKGFLYTTYMVMFVADSVFIITKGTCILSENRSCHDNGFWCSIVILIKITTFIYCLLFYQLSDRWHSSNTIYHDKLLHMEEQNNRLHDFNYIIMNKPRTFLLAVCISKSGKLYLESLWDSCVAQRLELFQQKRHEIVIIIKRRRCLLSIKNDENINT